MCAAQTSLIGAKFMFRQTFNPRGTILPDQESGAAIGGLLKNSNGNRERDSANPRAPCPISVYRRLILEVNSRA